VLRALAARKRPPHILAIDRHPPAPLPQCVTFFPCDLTSPTADQELTKCFRRHHCTTMIHAALHSQPKRQHEYSHELQSIGTMYLLHAADAARVRKIILSSTTEVYGAFPDNPNFLTEEHPLRGHRLSSFLRDRVDVERQFAQFAKAHPKRTVTILRPCTILGPEIRNYKTHLLKRPAIATIMGYDPLIQCVHEHDVERAFGLAIDHNVPGAFNIVGDGVIPLSRALSLMGKVRVPVPKPLLWGSTALLWHLNVEETPPTHMQFWQYPCVADGMKAKRVLKFTPVYSLEEVLLSFQPREDATHA
jgi:UDP-glucose 4-epimerase